MELDKIRELINMMKENDLSELKIVNGETQIMLKRGAEPSQALSQILAVPSVVSPAHLEPAEVKTPSEAEKVTRESTPETHKDDGLVEIVSPIVGTYYSAPSPNAKAFLEVGTHIDEEAVVCIIEAMKVMNEIKSEVKGTVRKVLVTTGQSVEYGQPLFLIEPD